MLTYSDRSPALASVRLTPEPPDDEIAALCDSFTVRDAPGRDAVRQALEPRDHGTLFTFAQRMAVLAMRESSPRRLHHGPTALVMSDVAHLDSWDIASASGLLRHAASHLGLEGGDLIRSVAALAVPDVARHMAGAADAHDLPIATGCNVVLTKYGFGLVGWWLHDYAPTCDLTGPDHRTRRTRRGRPGRGRVHRARRGCSDRVVTRSRASGRRGLPGARTGSRIAERRHADGTDADALRRRVLVPRGRGSTGRVGQPHPPTRLCATRRGSWPAVRARRRAGNLSG